MSKPYNPFDWYWLKTDGSVFSSARGAVISEPDAAYEAFQASGGFVTAWPKDASGAESDSELAAVLVPYGLSMNGGGVPVSVSSAQAKIQCLRTAGSAKGKTLLDDITAAVQSVGGEVQIWFTEARTWERTNPYVADLSSSLKLKPTDVDQLFIAASEIAA